MMNLLKLLFLTTTLMSVFFVIASFVKVANAPEHKKEVCKEVFRFYLIDDFGLLALAFYVMSVLAIFMIDTATGDAKIIGVGMILIGCSFLLFATFSAFMSLHKEVNGKGDNIGIRMYYAKKKQRKKVI